MTRLAVGWLSFSTVFAVSQAVDSFLEGVVLLGAAIAAAGVIARAMVVGWRKLKEELIDALRHALESELSRIARVERRLELIEAKVGADERRLKHEPPAAA